LGRYASLKPVTVYPPLENHLKQLVNCFKYSVLLIVIICFSGNSANATLTGKRGALHYSTGIHKGTVLPHNDMLAYLNNEYIRGIEINIWFPNLQESGETYPVLGAGYIFSSLGNRNVFGNVHSAFLSLLNPLAGNLEFKLNLGMAYATKRYDLHANYFNRAIGSHLNLYGQLAIDWKIHAGDLWTFRPGVSFHHISNGTVVSPNSGINMLTLHGGIQFRSGHHHSGRFAIERDTLGQGKYRFSFFFATGIKQMDRRIDRQIFTSSLVFDVGYMLMPELSIGLGTGFFFNDSWAYRPGQERDATLSPFQSAIHFSIQRDMGPIAFFIQPGSYVLMPARDVPYFTGRLGFRYKFQNNLTMQFAVKHHWLAIADYFEWGIGYELKR
jgi:hypothetical protein